MSAALDCIVIGSGASGVACASALLAAGRRVHMLDVGIALEPERQTRVDSARARGALTASNAPWLAEQNTSDRIPRKLVFGSDFPFRHAKEHLNLSSDNFGAEPSFARAGLSTVWGAAALPFSSHDIADWPVTERDLAPHFAACGALLGLSAEVDDLAEWLPLHGSPRGRLETSKQARILLETMQRSRADLARRGLRFGRARVAARSDACVYCGLCLHGCPERAIYSADQTLRTLMNDPRFSYQDGAVVERIDDGGVYWRARGAAETSMLRAERIFLAAGALSSTSILLKSANAYDRTVRILDSQYFVLPLLMFRGGGKTREEKLHTMAQLFLELRDPGISPYTIHLQLYTYNSLMAGMMRRRLGALGEPLARWGDAHFVLVQGYLHSKHSGFAELTQRRDGLEARGVRVPESRGVIDKVVGGLTRMSAQIGAIPVAPLMEIAEPGRGFHIGGSLPMSAAPTYFETDTLGRPFGWRRVHVVDATVLPSIPATTITYPVMANAHRIGAAVAAL